jgi:fructokinase
MTRMPVEKSDDDIMSRPLYAAIEGGGTKFVCAIGQSADRVLDRAVIPTGEPAGTLARIHEFIADACSRHGPLDAIGVACFGPLDLRTDSPAYGRILSTPKPGWSGTDLLGPLRARFGVPVCIDTDVNAAALAELTLGAARGARSAAYVTVGTGIGGGFAPAARVADSLLHPEMGHLLVRRDPRDLRFSGICPFHGDCLEGLASGPAIKARWNADLSALGDLPDAASIIAGYLGQLAATITLVASPQRLVFGGGVMTGGRLLPEVRRRASDFLNGYVAPLNEPASFDSYVVAARLGDAGLAGAFLLAAEAAPAARRT